MQLHFIDFHALRLAGWLDGWLACSLTGWWSAGGDVINFHLFCRHRSRHRREMRKRISAGAAGSCGRTLVNTLLIAKIFGTVPSARQAGFTAIVLGILHILRLNLVFIIEAVIPRLNMIKKG